MRAPFSVVIITGASSGLGASLAKAYAGPHVALGLLGRDRQRLEATARACEARGATVNTAIIDVTDPSAMPPEWAAKAGQGNPARAVADYIAGMTDRFAIAEHARLFDAGFDLR